LLHFSFYLPVHSECQCSITPYISVVYYRTLSVRNLLPDISVAFSLHKVSNFPSTLSVRRYSTLTSHFSRHYCSSFGDTVCLTIATELSHFSTQLYGLSIHYYSSFVATSVQCLVYSVDVCACEFCQRLVGVCLTVLSTQFRSYHALKEKLQILQFEQFDSCSKITGKNRTTYNHVNYLMEKYYLRQISHLGLQMTADHISLFFKNKISTF